MTTPSNNIQAYVLALGLKHRTPTTTKILDILEIGDIMLRQYIDQGIIDVYKDTDTFYKVKIIDYERYLCDGYVISLKPKKIDRKKLVYYTEMPDNQTKISELISFDYVNPSNKVKSDSCVDLLVKLNRIKWKVWDRVLDFERTPKSPITDEKGLEQYQAVSQWMRNAITDLSNGSDCFYLGHYYDKRGRVYNDGFLVDYQGDEWSKAAIEPVIIPEQLTERGLRAFQIDIANHMGLDKKDYSERLSTVQSLSNLANVKAKKPILFAKAVESYNKMTLSDYNSTDYMCQIDATASCLQIQAIIANDSKVAKYTNLTDISKCYDIYGKAAQEIIDLVKSKLQVSDIRDIVKKAVMTAGYNSQKQITVARKELAKKGLRIAQEYLEEIVYTGPKIRQLLKKMNKLFSSVKTDMIKYTMPDGFVVELPNITKNRIFVKNKEYKYKYMMRYDERGYDYEENWRSLAPNIIHSIDAYICRELIRRCDFVVYSIHDCFACHPNNIDKLRLTYIELLKEIQSLNMLEYIGKQINPKFKYAAKGKPIEIAVSPDSYCLC